MFDREELKEIIKREQVENLEDFQELMRKMTKEVLEAIYDGELTDHLGYRKHEQKASKDGNYRNGTTKKSVQSQLGEIELNMPRDRHATFEPKVVKKRQRDISGIEAKVISMYAKGMTARDIQQHIYDIYGYEISPETISTITDSVMEHVREWQARPLQPVYAVVFMDAMMVKMRYDGVIKNVAVYAILGIDLDGVKSCLGLYIAESESAKYWLTVMNELKNRGVQDILIFAVDNLAGISEAIAAAFPNAEVQKCIVHQIRNSLKFVPWKERKAVAADLRRIYTASSEAEGFAELERFAEKWDKKYPHISRSWLANWAELSTFYKYNHDIRTLIYTTNPIESYHRAVRKVMKSRGVFPSEEAVLKLMYLATQDTEKRWTKVMTNWGTIYSQLTVYFGDRVTKYS